MKKYLPIIVFLTLLIAFLYVPFLKNTFIADDDIGIALNANINNLHAVFSSPINFFRPLLYYIAYNLGGGLNPVFFRLTNILAHLGTTLFLFLFLLRISNKKIAAATAILFAVHPVLIESVTWISGGSYSLYGFFLMMSLYFYSYGREERKSAYIYYSIAAFVFSLMSSEKAIVFPAILALYEYCFSKTKFFTKKNLILFLPFIILATLLTVVLIPQVADRIGIFTKEYYQHVTGYDPLFQIPVAISFYLQLIFYPAVLTLYHSEVITDTEFIIRAIVTVLFFVTVIVSYKKSKPVFFGLAFFLISILITLNPLGISSLVAERYIYIGTAGILFAAIYIIVDILEYYKLQKIEIVLLGIVMVLLSIRTFVRNGDWATHEKFWSTTVATSPYSFQAHYNLATVYVRTKDYKKAIDEYQKTIVLQPKYAEVYQDAGAAFQNSGDMKSALGYYLKALELNPKLWKTLQNVGGIYFLGGKYEVAREYTIKALALAPRETNLYVNLGIIDLKLGQNEEAKKAFEQALRLNPRSRMAQEGMKKLGE